MVLLWIGGRKTFRYEADGNVPFVANSPFMVQMAMIGGLPFTALRDAVLAHPTRVEGFNNLFVGLGS